MPHITQRHTVPIFMSCYLHTLLISTFIVILEQPKYLSHSLCIILLASILAIQTHRPPPTMRLTHSLPPAHHSHLQNPPSRDVSHSSSHSSTRAKFYSHADWARPKASLTFSLHSPCYLLDDKIAEHATLPQSIE